MKRIFRCLFLFIFLQQAAYAQELFPNTEPASNIPKKVLGVRLPSMVYKEYGRWRSWNAVTFRYGISGHLELDVSGSASNHHSASLPAGFISTDGTVKHTHGIGKGYYYPYRFEGIDVYAKYKFLNHDGPGSHFRMAAYGELSSCRVAHDEAEPTLFGDNAGIGGGIIATKLMKKLAISATGGFILPYDYEEDYPNEGNVKLYYGNALNYSLSVGYRLLPLRYKNYEQTNVNLYCELTGKYYGAARIYLNGSLLPVYPGANSAYLEEGNYVEIRSAVQFIFHSNTRIDLGIIEPVPDGYGGHLLGSSYTRLYPVYELTLQHYFFLK